MPETELAFRPDVNVSIATGNGRFSTVDQWPVLGVHRGRTTSRATRPQRSLSSRSPAPPGKEETQKLLPVVERQAALHVEFVDRLGVVVDLGASSRIGLSIVVRRQGGR
jgi:hypothetical protein